MAAVLPFLEAPPSEAEIAEAGTALAGLGDAGNKPKKVATDANGFPLPVLAKPHSELTNLMWTRAAILRELATLTMTVERTPLPHIHPQAAKYFIRLSKPLSNDVVPWWGISQGRMPEGTELFSDNSKMRCPTFDLPAGSSVMGGACPGAISGQSVVPPATRLKSSQEVRDHSHRYNLSTGRLESGHYDLDNAICEYCVAGDTKVMVRGRGLVRVEDMVGAGEFEVWSGEGWRTTHAVMTDVRPTVELTTNWGSTLRLTADHRVLTKEHGWVAAGELAEGDTLVHQMPSESPFPNESALVTRAGTDGSRRHHNAVTESFPTTWSRDVGLVLGYILGDGTVSKGEYKTVSLVSSLEDASDLHGINKIVRSWCGTDAGVSVHHKSPAGDLVKAANGAAHVAWRVKGLVEFLEDCGLDKNQPPEARTVPSGIWRANDAAVRGFISGMFSTDGSICINEGAYKKVEVTLASVSRGLLEGVQQLLFSLGIRSNICAYETASRQREAVGYRRLWKLNIGAAEHVIRFHDEIGFFNERKQKRLSDALHICRAKKSVNRFPHVTSVVPTEKMEPVYDLVNVGSESQFVANGITVHNCYATGGKFSEASTQIKQLIMFGFIRRMVDSNPQALKQILFEATLGAESFFKSKTDKTARFNILPVRVHSSGDFYTIKYAEIWVDVAWMLLANEKNGGRAVRLWAPTRTHVNEGFRKFWAKTKVPMNFAIRPSAWHVGDVAPAPVAWLHDLAPQPAGQYRADGAKVPLYVEGTSDPLMVQGTSVLRASVAPLYAGKAYDFQCGTYALDPKAGKSCALSASPVRIGPQPDGVPSTSEGQPKGADKDGCRACWIRPDLRVNYAFH